MKLQVRQVEKRDDVTNDVVEYGIRLIPLSTLAKLPKNLKIIVEWEDSFAIYEMNKSGPKELLSSHLFTLAAIALKDEILAGAFDND